MKNKYLLLIKLGVIALILSVIPIVSNPWMPIWVLLFYVYWMIWSFETNPALYALVIGLFFDVALGDILGQNSLALILSSLFIFYVKQSFYFSNITTQQVYLFVASLIYLSVMITIQIIYTKSLVTDWQLLLTIILTPLVWPLVYWIAKKLNNQ